MISNHIPRWSIRSFEKNEHWTLYQYNFLKATQKTNDDCQWEFSCLLPLLLALSGETHGDRRIEWKAQLIIDSHPVVKALNDLGNRHRETGTWESFFFSIRPNPRCCFAIVEATNIPILVDEKGSRIPSDSKFSLDNLAVCCLPV